MNESWSTTSKIYLRDLEAVEAPQEKYLQSLLAPGHFVNGIFNH
ncbi:MAG: hypothetical protein WKF91_02220 [Segetibacter sp.]